MLGFLAHSLAERLLAALMAVGFGYINYRGAEETGRAEVVVVVVKLVILALFIVLGAYATFTTPAWPAEFLSHPSFAPGGAFGHPPLYPGQLGADPDGNHPPRPGSHFHGAVHAVARADRARRSGGPPVVLSL